MITPLKRIIRHFLVSHRRFSTDCRPLIDTLFDHNSKQWRIFTEIVTKTPELLLLNSLFATNGYQLRIAGGAVRDLLCGHRPKDIDLATDATPDQMNHMIRNRRNIWVLKTSSGHRNGTVMARVNDKLNYEITTLHKWSTDETPGKPIFITDWRTDAEHRDLTINAMYLSFDGRLYDYFDGLQDLQHRRIRFVDTAERPIRQNAITILRYFRFYCEFGGGHPHDPSILSTIGQYSHHLLHTSEQNLWKEFKKILSLDGCADTVDTMLNDTNIGKYLGFHFGDTMDTSRRDMTEFRRVLSRLSAGVANGCIDCWEGSTLLAALVRDGKELSSVAKYLQLSTAEKRTIDYIIKNRESFATEDTNELCLQLVIAPSDRQKWLQNCLIQCSVYCGLFDRSRAIAEQRLPEFPSMGPLFEGIRGLSRRSLKDTLTELKTFWFKSGFNCTDDELRQELDRILCKNTDNKCLEK